MGHYSKLPLLRTPSQPRLKSHYKREFIIAGICFSQMSVIYFCQGSSCCLYYRGVRNSEVSARQEMTVLGLKVDKKITFHNKFNLNVLFM